MFGFNACENLVSPTRSLNLKGPKLLLVRVRGVFTRANVSFLGATEVSFHK